uniref:RanBP2-type domain-containing protein n=1 Tax=Cannabis sativa TaxID=3483 RepID=A0A803QS86_CANSA
MTSRDKDKDQTTPHQPLLSSLVIRPSNSDGVRGTDYEPGEVRRDPPSSSRSDRLSGDSGYRLRAGSSSPVRRRDADHRYNPDIDHSGAMARSREVGSTRDTGRFRDASPPFVRGRGGGRPFGRAADGPDIGRGPFRGEGMSRNNPNVRPRDGDWFCPDVGCGNLNFARRDYCNKCNRARPGPGESPRRGYPVPPPPDAIPRRFAGPPLDPSPGRIMNGYRSPPRAWARNGPREFIGGDLPLPRHNDSRGRWGRDIRERSRSPVRGGLPPKEYRRDVFVERGRDDRRGMARNRIDGAY